MNETPPKQTQWTGVRSSNGTSFFKSGLFMFLLGQFFMAVVWLVGFSITIGRYDQRFSDMSVSLGRLEGITTRMDNQGTNFSHYGIAAEDTRLTNNEKQVHELQEAVKPLPVMAATVSRLDSEVRDLSTPARK